MISCNDALEKLRKSAHYIASRPRSGNADHMILVLSRAKSNYMHRSVMHGFDAARAIVFSTVDIEAGLEALKETIRLKETPSWLMPATDSRGSVLAIAGPGSSADTEDARHVRSPRLKALTRLDA